MVEPQLVDYIKKAREAGQSDEQTRALLYKNGWTEAEVSDAFAVLSQPQTQPQAQQPRQQPQQQARPQQTQTQTQPQVQQKPQYQTKPARESSHLVLKLLIVLIILAVIGGAGYFVIGLLPFSSKTSPSPVVENVVKKAEPTPVISNLATARITSVSQDYDITKMTVFAFSKAGDRGVYCLPKVADGKISCFINDQILDSQYNYKPSWAGFSPDGKRLVFIYSDPATKQAFIFENGQEGARYDGIISGPGFSNDSQSFMYIVNGTDKKSFVVLNGNANAPHDKIYGTPALSSDGRYILYGARDGQDLLWVADPVANANASK